MFRLPSGHTALMLAAQNGHAPCARALIEAGASLNSTQNEGWTALIYAAQHGHDPCTRLLIEAGARKDATTTAGWRAGSTALSLARQNGHQAICKLLEA